MRYALNMFWRVLGFYCLILLKAIYWLLSEYHRETSDIFFHDMSESANPGRSLLDQPILVFSRWSHLLSLRRESEPVKNPKNPEKKDKNTHFKNR